MRVFWLCVGVCVVLMGASAPTSAAPTASASPAAPTTVSLLLTTASGTAPLSLRRAVDAAVAAQLSTEARLSVISADDVRRRLELEGERQRAGCEGSEMAACIAEIKSALGVPWVMYVEVEVVGKDAVVGLSVSGETGGALSRAVLRTPADGATLLHDVSRGVDQVLRRLWGQDDGVGALVSVSGVAVVVGSAAAALGLLPVLQHAQAAATLQGVRNGDGDTLSRLAQAKDLQRAQDRANAAWQSYGLPLVVGGAVVIAAGVGGVIIGAGSGE